ncbi:MAG: palmitoyltransferase for Vac8p [Watsoniomyces obsoletus]|nr:MAG: palmitoyltransferase for Vac8p [Watsoniomyces obsoletus]
MGWIWSEVLSDGGYNDTLMPVNYLVLAVTSGIFGLVLTGFTGWHYSLAWRNQTTIEKLEKTRYVTGRKITMKQEEQQHRRTNDGGDEGYATRSSTPSYGEQLREIHTNMVPGVTRLEEGEEEEEYEEQNPYHHHQHNHHREFNIHPSSAQSSLQASYAQLERAQERARYETYLDEQDSEKLPHAFDLGWRANLRHLFGDRKWLWFVPVCTTTGDGWHWDPSPKWIAARDDLRRRRDERRRREELGLGWEGHS